MAIAFPTTPSVDEVYTFMGRTWVWNGVGWAYRPSAYTLSRIRPKSSGVLVYRTAQAGFVPVIEPSGITYL